ncbi:molybdopterin molybdochelatase [Arboricoccus pini]|uniref:Molybdopterin molybdenumtransferase n=1 Tax=Arboricoccus pini TaxID=1963835 RepID=A0A212QZJ2_9PROT|nr:molybdopterin molybdotransferase MoeA [Arboricoccus pini]SNB65009.1 molybdopterin molybdochelatase [Arboricoccus pini]
MSTSAITEPDCFAFGANDLSLKVALQQLEAGIGRVVSNERLPLAACLGRALAEPLTAHLDIPGVDSSAMDGYAFASASLVPGEQTSLRLREGRAAAGHPFSGTIAAGEALKILTGAPMPTGTDTVVMWEQATLVEGRLVVPPGITHGQNRRRRGEDMGAGQIVLGAGQCLGPQHLGVAARLGHAELNVYRRLRVALASSGDELAEPGARLPPGGVFDANRVILKAALASLPVKTTDLGILPDDPAIVRDVLIEAAARHDLIVTSGGASRGDEDHLVRTVRTHGMLHFWEVRMKPGRPLAMGRLRQSLFIGLPGNPVASLSAFLLFARPVILALAGATWPPTPFRLRPAGFTLQRTRRDRSEILRARLEPGPAGRAVLVERQASHILTSLVEAEGLILLEEGSGDIDEGQGVPFASLRDLGLAQ